MEILGSLQQLWAGFAVATTPQNLFYCLAGAIVGTLVGILPGLGPIAGIALLIPATFGLNPTSAIIMLAGIYYGAMYGGSTTSILINVPLSVPRRPSLRSRPCDAGCSTAGRAFLSDAATS